MKKHEKKQLNRLNLTCIMHFRNIRYTAHGQVPVSAPNSSSGTDIDEAMTQLKADGIRNVIVQPTYVITGFESDAMKEKVLAHKKDFDSVIICDSLMVTKQDKEEVCQAMAQEYHPDPDEILLFMGHGTEHVANELYPEMDKLFEHFGYSNMHMGTVEGNFSIESFLDELKNFHPDHIHLAPFMIVAGDHATNDMSGEDDDSWKSILEKEGYSVNEKYSLIYTITVIRLKGAVALNLLLIRRPLFCFSIFFNMYFFSPPVQRFRFFFFLLGLFNTDQQNA